MVGNSLLDHENAARILEEGWRLFQQKGYRGVTMDELCERCKLSKPTLYYYFKDKENLFVQVLQYKLKGFRTAIEQPGTIAERLEAFAAVILSSFQSQYSVLLHDREHLKRPDNLQAIRDAFYGELFEPLIALMRLGADQGYLQEDNPEHQALIFLGIINNFLGKNEGIDLRVGELAQKLVKYFLAGAQKKNE